MRIIVLFNLKDGVDRAEYEAWARDVDKPTVSALGSVRGFTVHRATGLLGSDAPSLYAYVEVLDITALDPLLADISSDVMQAISARFQTFADNPQFIMTEDIA